MLFTKEMIEEIRDRLSRLGIKDTQIETLDQIHFPITGEETVVIVKNGKNVRITLNDLYSHFPDLAELIINLQKEGSTDIFNVSAYLDKSGATPYVTLEEAITDVPVDFRKIGLCITFANADNDWSIWQYTGTTLDTWTNTSYWRNTEAVEPPEAQEGHNILPFDGFDSYPIFEDAISEQPYNLYIGDSPQPVQYTIVSFLSLTGNQRFYLKIEDTYYTTWVISTGTSSDSATDLRVISSSVWYNESRENKLFYNKKNKAIYAYDYTTMGLIPITNIQVVEENAPEADSTSNPNNSTKGSIVVDLEHDKLLTWDGNKWKEISGGKSAYEIALEKDSTIGTEEEWLASLKGTDGKSAYELAKEENPNIGNLQAWLNSLNGTDGKSAYEVWRDWTDEYGSQPNKDKTVTFFLASLKDSDYKMQAVTARPSTIAEIEADKIYLYPDGTGQFSTAIYTGDLESSYDSTKWVVLATNPGDLSGAFTDISGLRTDVNNLSTLVGCIADKTQRLTTLDNLNTNLVVDPETTVVQGYYAANGTLVTTGAGLNFNHTDFIPVEYGKTYTLYAPTSDGTQGSARFVAAFNESKVARMNSGGENESIYTVTDSNVKYIVISGNKNGSKTLFGCFEGEGVPFKAWMEEETHQLQYNDGLSFADKDDDTLVNKGDVTNAITPLQDGIEELQDVKDVADMFEKYSDVSPNLVIDPDTTVEQGYYSQAGVLDIIGVGVNFNHTDFIPVEYGKTYTLYAPTSDGTQGSARTVAAFNDGKVGINGAGGENKSIYTVTNSNVKYIVISGHKNGSKTLFGCFEGENVPFEEWHEAVQTVLINDEGGYDKKSLNAVVTKADVIKAIEDSKEQDVPSEGKMQFRYEAVATMHPLVNNLPAIKIYRDADNYMLVSLDKNRTSYYGGNHIFNFIAIRYNGVSSTVGDDVPPLMYYTSGGSLNDYGGNHANAVTQLNAPNHSLDNTDIGKTFAHSSGEFNVVLMRVVNANTIIISKDAGSPTTVPNGTITINNTEFVVNGTDNDPNKTANTKYLCPVEQNLTQTILLNGKEEVTEDGDYTCDYFDIVEEYDVNMPTEIIGVIKARVGSEDEPSYETPDSFFHIRNTYRFLPNMGCLIFKTFTALTNINILACLGTQSTFPFGWKIGNNMTDTYIYLPNSTHNERTITPTKANGYRSNENKYVSPTVWDDTIYLVVDSNTWADEDNPVNRVICKTPPDAASQCGYAVGYDRSMGVGKSLGNFTDKPLNIAKLGKIYPYSIAGREVVNGDTFTTIMYRMFFRPDLQPQGRICEYHYELNGKLVVYLDYSSSINDVIVIDEKWDNKPIEVVESRNVTLLTDMYNGGIRVRSSYVNGETAFMVVRVG